MYRSAAHYFGFSPLLVEPSALFTVCYSADRIIYVLLSFSTLLSPVASAHSANSCSHSAHVSELQGGTKGPFYRYNKKKL